MTVPPSAALTLLADPEVIGTMSLLLQHGSTLIVDVGGTVRSLLCDQLGFDSRYVDERIGTIFLDGKPADDIDQAVVTDGLRIALSAAMPGLVGAVLRRKGFYAAMRSTITYRVEEAPVALHRGLVHLKLFNLLVRDMGPAILARGIMVKARDLHDFLNRQTQSFQWRCSLWLVDGASRTKEEVMALLAETGADLVALSVRKKEA